MQDLFQDLLTSLSLDFSICETGTIKLPGFSRRVPLRTQGDDLHDRIKSSLSHHTALSFALYSLCAIRLIPARHHAKGSHEFSSNSHYGPTRSELLFF